MEHNPKTTIITGASRGVGLAVARRLAKEGRRMLLVARNSAALEQVCQELNQAKTLASATSADLSTPSGIAQFCRSLEADRALFGALVHAAGVSGSEKAENFCLESAISMFTLNCAAFQAISATILPALKDAKAGNLLAIASVAGLRGYPYIGAYTASKHALVGAVRSLAAETAKFGIRVNAVCPGYLETEMTEATIAKIVEKTGVSAAQARASLESQSPQQRLFLPEEVAESVAFLLSDGAAGISGQALAICGAELT